MKNHYYLPALRALALYTQRLHTPIQAQEKPDGEAIHRLVTQLGCVQIDTLQMVQRSHYLALWSRLGSYELEIFEDLIYGSNRRLFEGWQHAASIIPLEEYRYQMPHQRSLREHPSHGYANWLVEKQNSDLLPHVLDRIQKEGGLRASDFKYEGPRRGSWWDWKPAKIALEYQFGSGNLMVAKRPRFQRVYDLKERVLPDWVDTREPTQEERELFWIERSVQALGVCTPEQAADYTWMRLRPARSAVSALTRAGNLVEISAGLMNSKIENWLVHRDNLPLLEKAASGELQPQRTTFLSPFDSLFWARQRDQKLWGFQKSLEAYLPASKRIYGYFCLPILYRDQLVGRFDPKLERKEKRLHLKALYLEPGVEPDDELVEAVAVAMRDFLTFHRANDFSIEGSQPTEFGHKLLAAL
jgi:uncharacterized protein YcaQ